MNIRELRERRGWSRAELARRARLNPVTVGQIEAGRLKPYPSQLAKLRRALGSAVDCVPDDAMEATSPSDAPVTRRSVSALRRDR